MRGSETHSEKKAGKEVIQNEMACIPSKERVSSSTLDKTVLASLYESQRERREMSEQEEEVVRHLYCFSYNPPDDKSGSKHITPTYTEQLITQCTGAREVT